MSVLRQCISSSNMFSQYRMVKFMASNVFIQVWPTITNQISCTCYLQLWSVSNTYMYFGNTKCSQPHSIQQDICSNKTKRCQFISGDTSSIDKLPKGHPLQGSRYLKSVILLSKNQYSGLNVSTFPGRDQERSRRRDAVGIKINNQVKGVLFISNPGEHGGAWYDENWHGFFSVLGCFLGSDQQASDTCLPTGR